MNNGSAINLKSASLTFQAGANLDTSPVINTGTTGASTANLNFGSISNAKFTIKGVLNHSDSGDIDLAGYLNQLRKTVGIKLLYYTIASSDVPVFWSIGGTDAAHNGSGKDLAAGILHHHVRVTNFTLTQSGPNVLRYTLECVETA